MADFDGKWNCKIETPVGEQAFVLTVTSEGDRFTGSVVGDVGSMDIPEGSVDGGTLNWTMQISKPMPLTLTCQATISGDALAGKFKAGIFGSFAVSGSRA